MLPGTLFRTAGILVPVTLFFASCAAGGGGTPQSTPQSTPPPKPKTYTAAPPMTIDKNKQYTATIETDRGNLVLELFAKDAPVTVNNFVFLAREGFYDGTTFHRIIPGFMAQG